MLRSARRMGYLSVPCCILVRLRSCCTSSDMCLPCSSMTPMDSRKSSFVSSLRLARSHSARITVMGVRSSWEASEANCRSALKECSSRVNIRSKARLSRFISDGPRRRFSLAVRSSPSEMESAAVRMSSIGLNAPRAMSQPPPMVSSSSAGSRVQVSTRMVCISPDRSVVDTRPRIQIPATSIST